MMIWTSTSIGLCSVSKIILVWTQREYFWVADLITAFEPLQRLDALNHCRLPDIPNVHLNNRCYRMCQTKTILYVFSACFLLNYRGAEPTKDLSGMEENTDTCLKLTSRTIFFFFIYIKNQLKRRSRMSGYVGTLQHVQSSWKKL